MEHHSRRNSSRRPFILLAVAALLVATGLVSAMSASGGAPSSNKADAYGGPLPKEPKNPQSRKACDDYYGGPKNQTSTIRECRSKADRNIALKKCKKKSGAAKAKCTKAANNRYAKEHAAHVKQEKAEKACSDKYMKDSDAISPDDPNYSEKMQALSDEQNACVKRSQR
jgi:hypothetical protein